MTQAARVVVTSVATGAGELRALIHHPDSMHPLPGVVLVDGAGEGTADGWNLWSAAIANCGVVVLAHDKPGCGGSPGDWREQTFEDRAAETLAAVEALRGQPGVDQGRVGLLGISQGGWIAFLAASLAPERISQLVSVSGAGVTPVEQERFRISCAVGGDVDALAWVDERARRIGAGETSASIISAQRAYADQPWFAAASEHYDDPGFLSFASRSFGFDPATVLPKVRCRVFAAFGGADTSVPVARSAAILSQLLPANPQHALAIFPGGDHNLFITERDENTPLDDQLAPGFMPMLHSWLNTVSA